MNDDKKERFRAAIKKSKNNLYDEVSFDRMIEAMDLNKRAVAVKEARDMLQVSLRQALDFINKWW